MAFELGIAVDVCMAYMLMLISMTLTMTHLNGSFHLKLFVFYFKKIIIVETLKVRSIGRLSAAIGKVGTIPISRTWKQSPMSSLSFATHINQSIHTQKRKKKHPTATTTLLPISITASPSMKIEKSSSVEVLTVWKIQRDLPT